MDTKRCKECQELKPVTEFWKHPNPKDKLFPYCRECCHKRTKKYRGRDVYKFRYWAIGTLGRHRKKGLTCEFTASELEELASRTKICGLCNINLDWSVGTKGKGGKFNSPSLDRKDNGDVLTLNNIQIICNKCNSTKGDRTMEQFISYCQMIADKFASHRKGK